jgi:hypothetical protein
MAIWYVDPVSGNDANAGTSWGAAFKTFAAGPTAAHGVVAGDTIRCAKTADDVSVGTATWTNQKAANSITFASAITKTVDTMKAGWVTLGAGSVVTNGQSTAFVYSQVLGGSTGAALQVVTAATANHAYKNLGAVNDFSGNTQISFWFRSTTAFDCSGAQNLYINLCSGVGGATVVNALAMPKWVYAANTWYPIVIDSGAALGSSIQSVSITTTSAVSGTFYYDEMFASAAGGVTLWSLLKDNANAYYAIRTIRETEVVLMGTYSPTTASGAASATNLWDISWVGTTGTFTTYKRETLKMYGTTGPAATIWAANLFAGVLTTTAKALVTFSFGWNTTTNLQDGLTFVDNLIQNGTVFNIAFTNVRIENLVGVRATTAFTTGAAYVTEVNNVGAIASQVSYSQPLLTSSMPLYNRTANILFLTCGCGLMNFGGGGFGWVGWTYNFGVIWGNAATVTMSSHSNATFTIGVASPGFSNSPLLNGTSGDSNRWTIGLLLSPTTGGLAPPTGVAMLTCSSGDVANITILNPMGSSGYGISGYDFIADIGTFYGTGYVVVYTGVSKTTTIRVGTQSGSNALQPSSPWWAPGGGANNNKLFIQDFGGPGYARVYTTLGNSTLASIQANYFDLQTVDVHTAGSKAWKFVNSSPLTGGSVGANQDLKLASAAAVANKLVTVTCYVKQAIATTYQLAGIKVPAIFLPGYTSDIVSTLSGSTGTWYQLTVTFTPTADCVFDVYCWTQLNDMTFGGAVVWDDLVISQAP